MLFFKIGLAPGSSSVKTVIWQTTANQALREHCWRPHYLAVKWSAFRVKILWRSNWELNMAAVSSWNHGPTYRTGQVSGHCMVLISFNILRLAENGWHFAYNIFELIFLFENCCILIQISLKLVPKGRIDSNSSLVRMMASCYTGTKPLSEPVMT